MQQEGPNCDDPQAAEGAASRPGGRGVAVFFFVVIAIVVIVVGLAYPEVPARAFAGILKVFGLLLRAL